MFQDSEFDPRPLIGLDKNGKRPYRSLLSWCQVTGNLLYTRGEPWAERGNFSSGMSQNADSRVRAVLALIDSKPLVSVRELACHLHLSPGQLQRVFKLRTGTRISDLLIERRLQKAAQLLSAGGLSIKEIAHTVGYEHPSSFTRAFENRFAHSPKRYRNQSHSTKC